MLKENNRGQMIMINLLFLLMTIAVLVALIPALNAILNIAQQSDNLNCSGYKLNGIANDSLSYNNSLPSNTLACLAIDLYLPYIILVVLIGGVTKLLANRTEFGGI
jgi:beta-lactamase regulating signal transducer with metallopeptidase domain